MDSLEQNEQFDLSSFVDNIDRDSFEAAEEDGEDLND